jgi:hypothetical protein
VIVSISPRAFLQAALLGSYGSSRNSDRIKQD